MTRRGYHSNGDWLANNKYIITKNLTEVCQTRTKTSVIKDNYKKKEYKGRKTHHKNASTCLASGLASKVLLDCYSHDYVIVDHLVYICHHLWRVAVRANN